MSSEKIPPCLAENATALPFLGSLVLIYLLDVHCEQKKCAIMRHVDIDLIRLGLHSADAD